jgi:hypothetical protein
MGMASDGRPLRDTAIDELIKKRVLSANFVNDDTKSSFSGFMSRTGECIPCKLDENQTDQTI